MIARTGFFARLFTCALVFLGVCTFSLNAFEGHESSGNNTLQLLLDKVNQLRDEVRQMRNGQQDGRGNGAVALVDTKFTDEVALRRSAFTGAFAILLTPGIEQQQAQNALNNLKEVSTQLEEALKHVVFNAPAPSVPAVQQPDAVIEPANPHDMISSVDYYSTSQVAPMEHQADTVFQVHQDAPAPTEPTNLTNNVEVAPAVAPAAVAITPDSNVPAPTMTDVAPIADAPPVAPVTDTPPAPVADAPPVQAPIQDSVQPVIAPATPAVAPAPDQAPLAPLADAPPPAPVTDAAPQPSQDATAGTVAA